MRNLLRIKLSKFRSFFIMRAESLGMAALFVFGSSFGIALSSAAPMTGYVGALGVGQYQGFSEGGELAAGARVEFTRLVKHISLDMRYASGKYTYLGGALRFFNYWETDEGNHIVLGGGPGVTYAAKGNSYGNASQVKQPYLEYFVEGFGGYVLDFQNGVGMIFQTGLQFPFQRKYQSTSASPNNASYFYVRPYIALGVAFDVD